MIEIEDDAFANPSTSGNQAVVPHVLIDGQPIYSHKDKVYSTCLNKASPTKRGDWVNVVKAYIENKDFIFRSGVSESFAREGFDDVLYDNKDGYDRKRQLEWFIDLIKDGSEPQPGPFLLVCVTTIDCMGGISEGFTLEDRNVSMI